MSDIINTEATCAGENTANTTTKYTLDYVLEQIEKIQADTEHIKSAISGLSQNIQDPSGSRADAFDGAVKSRETTNQRLISFYEKMYDDLKPKPSPEEKQNKLEKMAMLLDSLHKCTNDSAASYIGEELRRLMND